MMVLVSNVSNNNVASYSPPSEPEEPMAAKAILICRPNSHKFADRTLTLDQPIKVGRSVARAKPTATNAIFDCKVLSRHHALLWYENGKFYLQDTKSSNGTFVNNNKLPTEESQEVSSGDIVQFGVDVVENTRKKVTHGCIIATLKLYLPDGKEAKASPCITQGSSHEECEKIYNGNTDDVDKLKKEICRLEEGFHRDRVYANQIAQQLVSFRNDAFQIQKRQIVCNNILETENIVLRNKLTQVLEWLSEIESIYPDRDESLFNKIVKVHSDLNKVNMYSTRPGLINLFLSGTECQVAKKKKLFFFGPVSAGNDDIAALWKLKYNIMFISTPGDYCVKLNEVSGPSLSHENSVVPLDDLYRLNQILQEAYKREQCLESKLSALKHLVDKTRQSAEDSWQVYVGEESLLSRIGALETQLQQTRCNWSDEKMEKEISKLRAECFVYQKTAKAAMEKFHIVKEQYEAAKIEQERAKSSAELDMSIARDQLEAAQVELQKIAQRLREVQLNAEETSQMQEETIAELKEQLEQETAKVEKTEAKLYQLILESMNKEQRPESELILDNDDVKMKEKILEQNEQELNSSNSNHISLMVAPVEEKCEEEKSQVLESTTKLEDEVNGTKKEKRVSFQLTQEEEVNNQESQSETETSEQDTESELSDFASDQIDSRTLKYQYQSAQREQNELKRKIENLEKTAAASKDKIVELTLALVAAKELCEERLAASDKVEEQLSVLEAKLVESTNENEKLRDRVNQLEVEKSKEAGSSSSTGKEEQEEIGTKSEEKQEAKEDRVISEELTKVEEELVFFKEKFAQSSDEKEKLKRDLAELKIQYHTMCDNMYNKYFWYLGPLVIIVIYLLLRQYVS